MLTVIWFVDFSPSYSVVIVYLPAPSEIGRVAIPFLSVVFVWIFPLTFSVTFLFGDAFPLLFRILTLNLPVFPSFIVKSFVSIKDLIVMLFEIVSDVFGLTELMLYFPGFKFMDNFPTPFEFVLTEYVLLFSLNLTAVFFNNFPFMS